MSKLSMLPGWAIAAIVLALLGVFFRLFMRGYDYIAYTFIFFALFILFEHFAPAALRRAGAVLVCLGLMYFCAVEIPIVSSAFGDKSCEKKYVIVLGAAVHGDTPSLALTHRLQGAQEYLEANPESIAIVSGGKGSGENITEAECMRTWLIENGIAPERVIEEPKAVSTMENLRFSFEIIRSLGGEPNGNTAIISSGYHLYRAKTMAKMLGVEAAGVAGHLGYPVYTLSCFIREAFGVTHLWVFGN